MKRFFLIVQLDVVRTSLVFCCCHIFFSFFTDRGLIFKLAEQPLQKVCSFWDLGCIWKIHWYIWLIPHLNFTHPRMWTILMGFSSSSSVSLMLWIATFYPNPKSTLRPIRDCTVSFAKLVKFGPLISDNEAGEIYSSWLPCHCKPLIVNNVMWAVSTSYNRIPGFIAAVRFITVLARDRNIIWQCSHHTWLSSGSVFGSVIALTLLWKPFLTLAILTALFKDCWFEFTADSYNYV